MGLRVNNNIAAINAHRNLSSTDVQMSKALERLSSGLRINRAADDAAGLAIAEGLRAQTGGLKVAVRNAQDGISVVQTAEGALTETHSILQRMRDLAVQSSNDGSVDDTAKEAANVEFGELKAELDRIAATTSFGSQKLLNAGVGASTGYNGTFQVGSETGTDNEIQVDLSTTAVTNIGTADGSNIVGLNAAGLKLNDDAIDTEDGAKASITALDAAIKGVSSVRATLGAKQSRFEHTINNLNVSIENVTGSESRIRDTDMAAEMANFTRAQIMSQAGTAMLAQANQSSQGVLRLLG